MDPSQMDKKTMWRKRNSYENSLRKSQGEKCSVMVQLKSNLLPKFLDWCCPLEILLSTLPTPALIFSDRQELAATSSCDGRLVSIKTATDRFKGDRILELVFTVIGGSQKQALDGFRRKIVNCQPALVDTTN